MPTAITCLHAVIEKREGPSRIEQYAIKVSNFILLFNFLEVISKFLGDILVSNNPFFNCSVANFVNELNNI